MDPMFDLEKRKFQIDAILRLDNIETGIFQFARKYPHVVMSGLDKFSKLSEDEYMLRESRKQRCVYHLAKEWASIFVVNIVVAYLSLKSHSKKQHIIKKCIK